MPFHSSVIQFTSADLVDTSKELIVAPPTKGISIFLIKSVFTVLASNKVFAVEFDDTISVIQFQRYTYFPDQSLDRKFDILPDLSPVGYMVLSPAWKVQIKNLDTLDVGDDIRFFAFWESEA